MGILNVLRGDAAPDIAKIRRRMFRRAPEVVWVTHLGETVVFNVDRGSYESLNDVATSVWQRIVTEGVITLDGILRHMHDEYELPPDAPADTMERDVSALLTRLEKAHAIVSEPAK